MMFGKIYESTFTGSMFGGGAALFAVWAYVVANTKPDNMVELNPTMLAAIIGSSVESVEDAIARLCAPDPQSRTKHLDGRRLLPKGEFIYFVINAQKYRSLPNDKERREYFKEKQRESRERKRVRSQTGMSSGVKAGQSLSNTQYSESESVQSTSNDVLCTVDSQFFIEKIAAIYAAYPLKVGRPHALKAIALAFKRGHSLDFLLERTKRFATVRAGDKSFCPHPATWFNQDRFNDDEESWQRSTTNQPQKPLAPWELALNKQQPP